MKQLVDAWHQAEREIRECRHRINLLSDAADTLGLSKVYQELDAIGYNIDAIRRAVGKALSDELIRHLHQDQEAASGVIKSTLATIDSGNNVPNGDNK